MQPPASGTHSLSNTVRRLLEGRAAFLIMRRELAGVGPGEAARGVERTDIWRQKLQGLTPGPGPDGYVALTATWPLRALVS